jgi:hypothetical protein
LVLPNELDGIPIRGIGYKRSTGFMIYLIGHLKMIYWKNYTLNLDMRFLVAGAISTMEFYPIVI